MPLDIGKYSVHKNQGWPGQLERLKRWYERVQQVRNLEIEVDDKLLYLDYVYTFFQNCFHLKDWILYDADIKQNELEKLLKDFMESHVEMTICETICIGTKHFDISNPKIDQNLKNFTIGAEYAPLVTSDDKIINTGKWFVLAGGKMYDLFDLIDKCMEHWDKFLTENNLYNIDSRLQKSFYRRWDGMRINPPERNSRSAA